jgi:mannose-6-phosphate isomerase-like protein (cupin superfamily)
VEHGVTGSVEDVTVASLAELPRTDLGAGSWAATVLSGTTAGTTSTCLGYARFAPGAVSTALSHATEELMFVVAGAGELRTDTAAVPFAPGDALRIPATTWHWIANTGTEDVVSVFSFPGAELPPTQRRASP